jgi:3-isopropylmalate/(R)-2-methylmalate dehydratase large subunit
MRRSHYVGKTVTEKILARAAGLHEVSAGDEVTATPDFVMAYELRGITDKLADNLANRLGVKSVRTPEKFVMFIDHRVPARHPDDEALHIQTRAWSKAQGIALFDRRGIGHQVATEEGYAVPGALVVHFDGHISQIGAYSALGLGIRSQIIQAFAEERVTLTVPASIRVRFTGQLQPHCDARDVFHAIVNRVGTDGCSFKMLEFDAEHLGALDTEAMQTIAGLAMFTGAVSAIVNPSSALPPAPVPYKVRLPVMRSDADARYDTDIWLDLNEVVPSVACPPSPGDIRTLTELEGTRIHVGYIGSCASGRLGDLKAAAEILAGRTVAPGFSLHVVPSSQKVMADAAKAGILEALVRAGAYVASASCDFCSGYAGVMTRGQRAVSTGTLNVPGRMGHIESEIYLCSPQTVAATALTGALTDPRNAKRPYV